MNGRGKHTEARCSWVGERSTHTRVQEVGGGGEYIHGEEKNCIGAGESELVAATEGTYGKPVTTNLKWGKKRGHGRGTNRKNVQGIYRVGRGWC